MFLFGPPNIEKLKARRNITGLIKALGYKKDPAVRSAAVRALSELCGAEAMEYLVVGIRDEHSSVRQTAAAALERLGWKTSNDTTTAWYWMTKRQWEECVALGDVAIEPLLTALRDPDGNVRKAAAESLDKLGWTPGNDLSAAWYWAGKKEWQTCAMLGTLAVEPLVAALKPWGIPDKERQEIANALVAVGRPAVLSLINMINDRCLNSDARAAAARVLGKIGDGRAFEPLLSLYRTTGMKDSTLILAALEGLGELGDTRAINPLVNTLGNIPNRYWRIRLAVFGTLVRLGDNRGMKPIMDSLQGKLPFDFYRITGASEIEVSKAAIKTLSMLGEQAVDLLIDILHSNAVYDLEQRKEAAKSLVTIYHQHKTSQATKQKILAVRDRIVRPHTDEGPTCDHYDYGGTGVDFPL